MIPTEEEVKRIREREDEQALGKEPPREKEKSAGVMLTNDPWRHRSQNMRCETCMWFVIKAKRYKPNFPIESNLGRCRRRCPTMNGYPVVFSADFCGDHKLDENKI